MTQMLRFEEWTREYSMEPPEPRPEPEPPADDEEREVVAEPTPAPEFQPVSMISTLVVSVWEGEVVHIATVGVGEFGLDPSDAVEVVPPGHQKFMWAFPYDKVKANLESRGWVHASTQEA